MATPPTSGALHNEETAVPTLKVMRLQSPELDQPTAGSLQNKCLLGSSFALPDSFGVIHVGETFTAYLGALNVSPNLMVRRLTVSAQLQTPSQRWPLPSSLDVSLGVDVRPGAGVDAIVSKALEEAGQHILRVEVGYQTSEGSQKTLRKFYRFNVSNPLAITERIVRSSENSCFVSIGVENASQHAMVITTAKIECREGLVSNRIGSASPTKVNGSSATELFDGCGLLEPKASFQYLFCIQTTEAFKNRGIACGDELGVPVFEWSKTMGETGRYTSVPIICPIVKPPGMVENNPSNIMMGTGSDFVVQGTGLSIDVAKVAASRAAGKPISTLDEVLPVTVEPIHAPPSMELATPHEVKFLIVNHSSKAMDLQLQFRLDHMSGVAVCGKSYKNLGEVPPNGGSVIEVMRFLPLVAGLLRVQGCCVMDLTSGKEVPQPPLFHSFVNTRHDQ